MHLGEEANKHGLQRTIRQIDSWLGRPRSVTRAATAAAKLHVGGKSQLPGEATAFDGTKYDPEAGSVGHLHADHNLPL